MNQFLTTYRQTRISTAFSGDAFCYRFNGKDTCKGWRIPLDEIKYNEQQDHESGLHYYGARYYDSETLAGWLSVDPMTDKYPSVSSYAYCVWNPVKLVDPDGRKIRYAPGTSESFKKQFAETVKYMNSK